MSRAPWRSSGSTRSPASRSRRSPAAAGAACGWSSARARSTDAFARASAEAKSAFGNGALYAERLVGRARHIEVQIVGDGKGGIVALGERECSLQRRSQKIVELAPSPNLKPALRKKIVDAAIAMAKAVKYRSLGTFEFLVDEATTSSSSRPIRACRSSTPSPRKCGASIW